jgi:BrnA antitoxin of type II toxin-antitoxin system
MRSEYDFKKGKRGAIVPAATGKTRITIRLDDDILQWFRGQVDAAGGGNYQSMINEALRSITTEGPAKLETVVRRVVREELKRAGDTRRPKRAKAA